MDPRTPDLSIVRSVLSEPLAIDIRRAREIERILSAGVAGRDDGDVLEALFGGPRPQAAVGAGGVALIPLHGFIIQRGPAWLEFYGIRTLESFIDSFEAAIADDDITHVIVHVDSPGGSVSGVPEAGARMLAARGKKPITAICDPLMASAAYWLGSTADEVVITPSGMPGSIGVISMHLDWSEFFKGAGVKPTIITHGRFKAEGNPYEPLTPEAQAHIQQIVGDFGALFDAAVAEHRGIDAEDVQEKLGGGRVFTAERAVEMGLGDRVATLDEVLAELGVRRRSRPMDASSRPLKVAAGALPEPSRQLTPAATIHPLGAARSFPTGFELEVIEPAPGASAPAIETADPDGDGPAPQSLSPNPTGPEAQEAPMADTATKPQADAGADKSPTPAPTPEEIRAGERERQRRIRDICGLHPEHVSAEKLDQYLNGPMSAEQVMDDVVKQARAGATPKVTSPQPEEERRPEARVIRHRGSSRIDEPGFAFGMVGLALAAACHARANGRTLDPKAFLDEGGFDGISAAMRSDRFDQGGAWVPENYLAGEFIELLRPMSAVRRLNPRFVELTGGQASLPGMQGGATSYYKSEASRGTKSEGTSRRVNLVSRELMTFVPITYQLLRRATPDAGAMVRDDAVAASAQRSDLAFIRGDGTADQPKGLRYQALGANIIPANATVNLANVTEDLGKLRLALLNANVKMIRPGFIMAPRTEHYLMTVRDGNGNYAFRTEMLAGMLWGYPYATTTQIPINLGSGSDESEVYFADFADVVIGEEDAMQIDVFDQVTYWDGSAWQSAAQNNEIVLRIVEHHDIGVRYPESVAILTGVTWGV